MKRVLLVFVLVTCVCGVAQAGSKVLDSIAVPHIETEGTRYMAAQVHVVCIDGYKFVVAAGAGNVRYPEQQMHRAAGTPMAAYGGLAEGLSILQINEAKNGKAIPARCK